MNKTWLKLVLLFGLCCPNSQAGILDINYLDPNELGGIVPQDVANEAVKMFAIYTAHRPYTGATSIIHSNGFDLMIEGTLVKIGSGIVQALQNNGLTSAPPSLPAVPMAKVNLRKAFSTNADLGLSGFFYRGQSIIGGDLKIVLHDPEEGPSLALRLGYTYASVPYAYVKSSSTISPEIVISRRLYFAEPYLGIGGRLIKGSIEVPFKGSPPLIPDFSVKKDGSATTAYAFTGLFFRILGSQGLRLGIEGSFDISGYHTIGGVFGIGF